MTYLSQEQVLSTGFKSVGSNIRIGDRAAIYDAACIEIGDNSRIDDFCIVSGRRFGRVATPITHTDGLSERLLRLPLWIGVDRNAVLRTFIDACAAVCGTS